MICSANACDNVFELLEDGLHADRFFRNGADVALGQSRYVVAGLG